MTCEDPQSKEWTSSWCSSRCLTRPTRHFGILRRKGHPIYVGVGKCPPIQNVTLFYTCIRTVQNRVICCVSDFLNPVYLSTRVRVLSRHTLNLRLHQVVSVGRRFLVHGMCQRSRRAKISKLPSQWTRGIKWIRKWISLFSLLSEGLVLIFLRFLYHLFPRSTRPTRDLGFRFKNPRSDPNGERSELSDPFYDSDRKNGSSISIHHLQQDLITVRLK